MMNSLFETFDPMASIFKLNMLSLTLPLIFSFTTPFFILSNRKQTIIANISNFMFSELKASLNNKNNKFNILMMITIFFFILLLNLFGLIPYVYTMTSQMLFTLSLSLPFWMAFLLFNLKFNMTNFLSHLVPLSTPIALSQFMVIIESISLIIRPITLSVRLCANMTAGHILMALTSKSIFMLNYFSIPLILLLLLEIAVAFIQSYVFTMLLTMYLSETS